jgi:methionyl-tRNA formyltransferase
MRIACIGYRKWALSIYEKLQREFSDYMFLMQLCKDDFSEIQINKFKPNFILFYGWSDIISDKIINDFTCIMLHPSPLPLYRGGSPLQNQIIRNEKDSAVTLFIMDKGIDTGDIIAQEYLSLEGSLNEIFKRMTIIGFQLTKNILEKGFDRIKQDGLKATYFARRKPSMSEITAQELLTKDAEYLYNKIRMLQAPYPNPYIKTADDRKLIIKLVEIE